MIQLSNKLQLQTFKGKNMQNGTKEFLDKVNSKINNNTVPEFGTFAPISADIVLDDDSCLVFQVKPVKEDDVKKRMDINFLNADSKKMASSTKIYPNKAELIEFIKSVNEEALKSIIKDFKHNTK